MKIGDIVRLKVTIGDIHDHDGEEGIIISNFVLDSYRPRKFKGKVTVKFFNELTQCKQTKHNWTVDKKNLRLA